MRFVEQQAHGVAQRGQHLVFGAGRGALVLLHFPARPRQGRFPVFVRHLQHQVGEFEQHLAAKSQQQRVALGRGQALQRLVAAVAGQARQPLLPVRVQGRQVPLARPQRPQKAQLVQRGADGGRRAAGGRLQEPAVAGAPLRVLHHEQGIELRLHGGREHRGQPTVRFRVRLLHERANQALQLHYGRAHQLLLAQSLAGQFQQHPLLVVRKRLLQQPRFQHRRIEQWLPAPPAQVPEYLLKVFVHGGLALAVGGKYAGIHSQLYRHKVE
ncbi:hypothetical protein LRS06_24780 [Hymenobacter sp. J193]|nr:hypothetical protein [Hymenobacter sp. J193]MCR5890524.1 hypothetical protein [Hymenobacter sp. J193]MCR5890942.1 hypothetical protein [Hymenobacter sp. J193]